LQARVVTSFCLIIEIPTNFKNTKWQEMSKFAQNVETKQCASTEERMTVRTLVIGNISRWNAEGRVTVSFDQVRYTEIHGLTESTLECAAPDIILSPLVGDDFDVMEVAIRLSELGYKGRYRAISQNIPNADMIRTEVRDHAPELDFDLLPMSKVANDGP